MTKLKLLLATLFLVSAPLTLAACDMNEGPAEESMEEMGESIDEAGDELEDIPN